MTLQSMPIQPTIFHFVFNRFLAQIISIPMHISFPPSTHRFVDVARLILYPQNVVRFDIMALYENYIIIATVLRNNIYIGDYFKGQNKLFTDYFVAFESSPLV